MKSDKSGVSLSIQCRSLPHFNLQSQHIFGLTLICLQQWVGAVLKHNLLNSNVTKGLGWKPKFFKSLLHPGSVRVPVSECYCCTLNCGSFWTWMVKMRVSLNHISWKNQLNTILIQFSKHWGLQKAMLMGKNFCIAA
jgi:hypothetical protein